MGWHETLVTDKFHILLAGIDDCGRVTEFVAHPRNAANGPACLVGLACLAEPSERFLVS